MSNALRNILMILLTILLMLCCASALAVAAYPGIVDITEPATGETVQIYNRGDEHFSYMIDTEGNLLVLDANDRLRYVTEKDGAYTLGDYKTQVKERTAAGKVNVNGGITGLQNKLQPLLNEVAMSRPVTYKDVPQQIPLDYTFEGDRADGLAKVCTPAEDTYLEDVANYAPREATCPLLVLKLQFRDIKCIFTDKQWHDRIFENGVTQYYSTVSNGKFTYVPAKETGGEFDDGVVTVTLPFDCPRFTLTGTQNSQLVQNDPASGLYRGTDNYNYAIYNMGSLYAYAMLAAESSVDIDTFDRDGDGFISPTELAVLVVFSGYEAAYSNANIVQGKPGVWGHSWMYNNMIRGREDPDCHYMTMTVGTKRVCKYTVVGELANFPSEYSYDDKSGTPRQAQFGTPAHELGHDLGLPDLYPTGLEGPTQRVEGLSLMGTGNWGALEGGELCASPTQMDPISKIYLGFYDAETAVGDGKYTLYTTEPASRYNILRVNTDDPDVYYLIENRQYVGYDAGLVSFYGGYEGGLVVWRVDDQELQSRWQANTVNNEEDHYGLMPLFLNKVTNPITEIFEPFWSAVSPLKGTLLKGSTSEMMFTALSQPNARMELALGNVLIFADSSAYDVPAQAVAVPMAEIDVSGGVSGGQAPYAFSLTKAPDWLHISKAGKLSGTPETAEAATTAVVTVTDSLGNTDSTTIAVGEVKGQSTPPRTGDDHQPLLYALLLLVSLGGVLLIRRRRRV